MFQIERLAVENLTEGCVTDAQHPRIAYSLVSDRNHVSLQQAEITVGTWSTTTREQAAVVYEGEALKPFSRYPVHVTARASDGETAEAETSFETGRLDTPWQGVWITDVSYHFTEKHVSPKPMTFRKMLHFGKKVKEAKLYVTAFGIYELQLDGEKIGRDYFAPGYTSYKTNLQYQVYDVSGRLTQDSTLTAVVAGGWAVGAFNYRRVNRAWADRQALLAELRVVYEDGSTDVIGTDESWEVTEEGSYRAAEFYIGETYDAGVNPAEAAWRKAGREQVRYNPQIRASYGAMVRAHEEFHPVSVTRAPGGMLIYDMGQNMAGVIKAVLRGQKGQKIVFRHAEVLMNGELYTKPLRSALQEAVYYCRDGEQTYSPRLTYMGFRYVGVEGIEEQDLTLTALALYSDVQENGTFTSSDPLLNKLQNAIVWGTKSNFVDIPTDCPQRDERMGWTGDIAVFSPTAAYNFNTSRFLEKWLLDVKAEQRRGGGIPMVVPNSFVPMQWELMIPMAVDHWGDACIWVAWAEYQARGDIRILQEMYPTMQRYLKACKFWAEFLSVGRHRRIWTLLHHYGDWCAPNVNLMGWMSKGKWTATAALSRSSANVAEIAAILGKPADAAYYRKLSRETAEAYRKLLMDPDCRLKEEFQTGYVLPLHYGMLSEEDRKKTAAHLAEMVRKNDYHIATGFPGTPYILFALAENGYEKEAYRMLMTDTCPSWLYEVKAGGTTIWERWDALRADGTCNTGEDDGTGGMVSFNHYASGAVGAFLYQKTAGIEALEAGYRRFRIAPLPGGGLTGVSASVRTPYGKIVSEWKRADGTFELKVQVPVGTTCICLMPDGSSREFDSGSYTCRCRDQEA